MIGLLFLQPIEMGFKWKKKKNQRPSLFKINDNIFIFTQAFVQE